MEEILANPLNPRLYYSLRTAFSNSVKVANEGEAFVSEWRRDLSKSNQNKEVLIQGGEEYRVCCPFCRDTKHRLYVNHKWGTHDESLKAHWNHLIHCFNEECDMEGFEDLLTPYVRNRPMLPQGAAPDTNVALLRMEWPGECVPLTKLPGSHPALEYLRGRKFDPAQIQDLWDVKFCVSCPETPRFHRHLVEGRIIIPIYWGDENEMVGWQARAIDGSEPKYYTSPSLKKRYILYNGQRAAKFHVGVLVEGVTDAWRIGPRATALLGKSVSFFQRDKLCQLFGDRTLINMLDPDALDDIDRVHKQLKPENFPGKYHVVRLPAGTDAGSSETAFLYSEINRQAKVEVSPAW